MEEKRPTRILIYGVTGAGKTTLAERLSRKTGLPWHSVDDLTFETDWVTVPLDEQRARITKICEGPEWILDTAYGAWLDIPWSRVELVVALDFPRWLSFSRLLRRTVMRQFDQKSICNGNHESLKGILSKESILVWHFRSFARKRARIRRWVEQAERPRVLRFSWPWQVERWLSQVAPNESRTLSD